MQSARASAIAFYRRLSLRAELAIGFIAVLALTLVVGLVSLLAQYRSVQAVNKLVAVDGRIADLTLASNVAMLKARRAEKDFLIFQNEFGFEEARSRYTTLLRTNLAEVRQGMADVRQLSGEQEAARITLSIEEAVVRYEAGFLKIVDLYGTRGRVSTGFEGKFRATAHEIEEVVRATGNDRLMADLLTLRRHEKDFIARGNDNYAQSFAQGIVQFKADLAAASLPAPVREKLLAATAGYQRWFEQYVETDARIDTGQAAYLAAAHTVEPLLEKLQANAELNANATVNAAENEARIAVWTICAAVLLALVLGLAVALMISRSITKSVGECLGFARRVAQGELSTRLAPRGDTEFGILAAALNRMAETLDERIAGQHQAEAKITRLNRVYAVLSGINAMIVRARDREALFGEACRVAVEAGHFAKVWVGIVERGTQQFRMAAAHGGDPLFFPILEKELARKFQTGGGLVSRALVTRQPVIVNDMASDPEVLVKDYAVEGGARSLAILPLIVADEAVGVFALNADVPGFFDAEEIKLLIELAGNIAYAIDHIDKQERIDYLAYYDELTGLANRSLFLERVTQYVRSASAGGHKLILFLVDLERFKNINDSVGRPAGDALLRQVSQWLVQRTGDVNLLARVGADHFAVVMPKVRQAGDVAGLLDKIVRAFLDHPFRLNDAVFRVAAKIGAAVFPEDGADADTLFRNAEAALKKAKASGDRYLFYRQEMTEKVAAKLALENQLRQALERNEFVLHYQPKVSLESGKLTSAEALIRWNDPRSGLVPPGRFIPVLEETGLIYDVGRWALQKAIEDYLRWRNAGLPAVRIAVNVSPLQLRNRGFVAEIGQVLGADAQAAAGLELEITESLMMEDVKHNIASLQAIRAMGVTIAIDDFGTGFSSLSYLARLPVDSLKIDRSFVIDMTSGPQGLSLISTIINLAHGLNLKVVAEGVETEEQSRLLHLLNCDEMQGFLFSRPVPAEEFERKFMAQTRSVEEPHVHSP